MIPSTRSTCPKHHIIELDAASEDLPDDEAGTLERLQGLADVRNQDDLERDITYQANLVMIDQEDERDRKRIEKTNNSIRKLETQLIGQRRRLQNASNQIASDLCQGMINQSNEEIAVYKKDISDIQGRLDQRHQAVKNNTGPETEDAASGNKRLPGETQRDFLIRTGKITPFAMPARGGEAYLAGALMDAEEEAELEEKLQDLDDAEPISHRHLRLPGFQETLSDGKNEFGLRSRKRAKLQGVGLSMHGEDATDAHSPAERTDDEFVPLPFGFRFDEGSEVDVTDEEDEGGAIMTRSTSRKRPLKSSRTTGTIDLAGIDDGNEKMYQARLNKWVLRRGAARQLRLELLRSVPSTLVEEADENEKEWFKPCPDAPDHYLDNEIKLPGDIYPSLFDYQKTGVQWLGELYNQNLGGIIGDEMGLGKTIQMISFLAALHHSKLLTLPVIIVAPATVLRQWVNEFHTWWPPLRVSILHSSGTGMLNMSSEDRMEEAEERHSYAEPTMSKSHQAAKRVVDRVVKHGHVLVTTYAGLQTYSEILTPIKWGYAVLDEGHKIKNPNTAITINCKLLRTSNRVILSGTPMQNNLTELWSLFDFVFPMRLGNLLEFKRAFEVPIKLGGYANATNAQILTATKCAETLKLSISPFLLQRYKVDVASDLPKKSEQVLFCKLTVQQRTSYENFLKSKEMEAIADGRRNTLDGISHLRKICNHPDLLEPGLRVKPGYKWGSANKSGKMQVLKSLLQMWKRFGHKTLLFSQGTQMLDIIESFLKRLDGFNYLRMDGKTHVKDRQTLVDRFNKEPDLHVFLLTTRVGGLGVNLTGANRVIIFDPDWNPSTDIQARERAWRLGQKREVTIYRLMSAGTIEEKMYHRQIFKQFLTNKVLKDPKQSQSFQMKDLHDLFSLGSADDKVTETGDVFKNAQVLFNKESAEDYHAELHNITGLTKLEEFHDEEAENAPANEDRIMEGILGGVGIHSALEHDQIMGTLPKNSVSRINIERDAKAAAASAAAVLRRAAEMAKTQAPGTVTWTGEHGSAGRPVNFRNRAGPSSAGILSGLANRQALSLAGADGPPPPSGINFMKLIKEFIVRQGGSAPSQMLVNHFNRFCNTERQSTEFKYMLGEIAILEKSSHRMRGRWVLKPAYK
ncbi:putative DNA repair and recombination protein RAD26 [Calycina marina]|uniref:DNA repair and recombination protein RAD26 n=1 Tax=Calycina marina TaxID=1763456 RepID=A0A9P7Z773_9HELO|nr:putative DNA repair and recombination protein RAD26 [Calycina marina]